MVYFKLSFRNAKRSFTDYLLYVMTMTILLAVMEVSNCIAIAGKAAGFQAFSLPLLITVIQIILAGYIDTFMLKQRAKEFASYLLLGMGKNKLTRLFLCEILLIGIFCFWAGTTIGFAIYHFFFFREMNACGHLYGKSMLHSFFYFSLLEMICSFRLKTRLKKLQIRELMYEKNRNQKGKNADNPRKWGAVFFASFICLMGFVCGIVFLPEDSIVPLISVAAVPLLLSVFAFYKWIFGFLYSLRRKRSTAIYQKNRLYIMANVTSNFKTAAVINAVFCTCFLFSAACFITGRLMLQPKLRLFDADSQQWMGTSQISICIVFMVIYFSILSLQLIIELRQDAENIRILHCIGKSNRQIKTLVNQQIAVKLTLPMIMALLIFSFCLPLLNRKLNLLLPVPMRDALLKSFGEFFLCTSLFYLCYFFVAGAMGRQCLLHSSKSSI